MPRVLIVDDDATFVDTCTLTLRHDGFEVTAADSVASAVNALATDVPHAMLLDWKLPDGTGLDVLQWLDSRNRRIPAALITGFWFQDEFEAAVSKAKRLGVAAWARRGIDLDDPSEVVRRVLDPLTDVHSAVLRGDEAAREVLTMRLLQHVVPRLRRRSRLISAEMATDAVTDAIVRHLAHSAAFNPVRHVSIDHFIWVIARRNLSNAIRTTRRDLARDSEYAKLLGWRAADSTASGHSEGHQVLQCALQMESDPHARSALQAWLAGAHGSFPWKEVPALAGLSPSELVHEIKRHKDRFIARAKRVKNRRQKRNRYG